MYVPGKIAGSSVTYLLDTGATDNILAKSVFNQLPSKIKSQLNHQTSTASLADGSGLLIYGSITLNCRVRCVPTEITFYVANVAEDAILGMQFFTDYQCHLLLDTAILKIGGHELYCVDKHGNNLSVKVQVTRATRIPANSEYQLQCRLTNTPAGEIGLVEHHSTTDLGFRIASTLVSVTQHKKITVRCINPHASPVELRAGSSIALYTAITEGQIAEQTPQEASMEINQVQDTTPVDTRHVPDHVKPLLEKALPSCSTKEQEQTLTALLVQYAPVFSKGDHDLGVTELVQHEIPTLPGTAPIKQAPRRLGIEKDQEVERQVQKMVEQGLVEPADSPWSSPVVLVKKKDDSWRLCLDYRRLNNVTRKDAYPLPRIDDSLDALSGSMLFSTLDLISGYWQLKMSEDASNKAAFVTKSGLWKPKRLPFGLTSAPATFERLMEKVLHGLTWNTLLLYLDDIVVFAPDFNTHMTRLQEVLERFKGANLKLKPSKCELLQQEVKFLGHIVSKDGVKTDPDKIKAVKEWKQPTCQTEVRTFLGFLGYYRRFCPDYATIARPLNQLTAKGVKFQWTAAEEHAFQTLREYLITAPVLAYPDPKLPYTLDTDASLDGIGAVLSQTQDGEERPIAYYSKTLSSSERNYCTTRRELLGVILSVKHFRPYLYGKQFTLRTDHASLQWLYRRKEPAHQVARWLEMLAEYQFTLEHRPGNKHNNADGLSRCVDCKQCQRIEERDGGPSWKELTATAINLTDDISREVPDLQRTPGSATARIITAIETRTPIPRTEIDAGSSELKKLAEQLHLCRVEGSILEYRTTENDRARWVTVCPTNLRPVAIQKVHTQHHSGVNRTYKRLRMNWYWPGMTGDVRRLIKTCEICQAAKHSTQPRSLNQQRLFAGRPWQVVSIDLVGPLSTTPRGNKMILVLSDHFTRWRDAVAIPDSTTETVANVLDRQIFNYFGLPEKIHSDLGTQFESKLMYELCRMWKITKTRTTSYHPQGNGVVERGNKDLGNALRALLLRRDETDWDLLLPQIMRSFRAMPHTMTQESPNFLMFGRELNLPDTLIYGPTTERTTRSEYAQTLQQRLEEAYDSIRDKQHTIRVQDPKGEARFITGDMVWLQAKRYKKGETSKLQPKYYGPYKVTEVFSNNTYEILQGDRKAIINEDRLKLHHPSSVHWGNAPSREEPQRQPPRMGQNVGRPRKRPLENELPEALMPERIPERRLAIRPEAVEDDFPIIEYEPEPVYTTQERTTPAPQPQRTETPTATPPTHTESTPTDTPPLRRGTRVRQQPIRYTDVLDQEEIQRRLLTSNITLSNFQQ